MSSLPRESAKPPFNHPNELKGFSSTTSPTETLSPRPASTKAYPQSGSQLGSYKLVAEIGRGGMGVVFRAFHIRLLKQVAIKLLPANEPFNREVVERFQREMQIVGQLQHPNIVLAHDAGEFEALHFLVMEFIEGATLEQVARRWQRLAINDCCAMIHQAATGLHHAHCRGLVHRDIKPSNLMLDQSGIVKILDLGLARWSAPHLGIADLTASGHWMGTLLYMAPEQAANARGAGVAADLYSLGATLYRLLSGRAPLGDPESNPVELLSALMQGRIEPIGDHRPDCPAELAVLIERMLALSPADRPASAAQVAEILGPLSAGSDLKRLLTPNSDQEVRSAPDSAPAPVQLPARRPAVIENADAATESARGQNLPASHAAPRSKNRSRQKLLLTVAAGLVLCSASVLALWNGLPEQDNKEYAPIRLGTEIGSTARPTATLDDTARWVIDVGGYVATLDAGGGVRFVDAARPALPEGPYVVTRVWLPETKISDDDLKRLAGLHDLVELNLSKTSIGDRGLEWLVGLPELLYLNLVDTKVTNTGLHRLRRLPALRQLHLSRTDITDGGLAHLRNLKLEQLTLDGTQISDAGIPALLEMRDLRSLNLVDTLVSPAGLTRLKEQLPRCSIEPAPPTPPQASKEN